MSRRKNNLEMPGTDSFLDVIANLVGILIILVVVVGASAATAWTTRKMETVQENPSLTELKKKSEQVAAEALKYERDNRTLHSKIKAEQSLVAAKQQIRHQMLTVIESAKRQLDEKKNQLGQKSLQQFEQKSAINRLKHQLQLASYNVEALQRQNKVRIEKIDHYPTPVAKTVFNREYHFRLKNGRLVEVPLDALVQNVKSEMRVKAEKLYRQESSSTVETVGPVGNFRLQYLLGAATVDINTPNGPVKQRVVEFKQFVLLPIDDQAGDLLADALKTGSTFERFVHKLKPEKTTISVWVYPENYKEFNQLKNWLYERGFQTAVWPLSKDAPISGGPNGFRSASQ